MAYYRTKKGTIIQLDEKHINQVIIKNVGLELVAETEIEKPAILKKGKKKVDE